MKACARARAFFVRAALACHARCGAAPLARTPDAHFPIRSSNFMSQSPTPPTPPTRTLPAAVFNMLTFEQVSFGPLAAAAILVTLPVLLFTIFIQKEIVAGLTHGGVKGS